MLGASTLPHASAAALLTEAERFLTLYAQECRPGQPAELALRLTAVKAEVEATGSYTLTPAELEHGARVAWRNATRCIGRLPWKALEVRDLRNVTDPAAIFAGLISHLHTAFHGGRIRPVISVFGPGVRLHNPQLIRYAGYVQPGGRVVGDPLNVALTQHLMRLGWTAPVAQDQTPFDVLPLAIESAGQVRLFEWPREAVAEVPITHPSCPAIAELGLRWHALPVISDMVLEIGGLHFGCAPFNGWYVQTEIAARNLADADRYDQLPAVARAFGWDTRSERTLWRDRALVELNVAVLHSFDQAGVRLSDHHAVARQFVQFETQEQAAGRPVYARWSWLIPPLSPATTAVWPRQYTDLEETPAFRTRPAIWEAPPARSGCPVHAGT